jgi:DHA1 family multidrug resistance protein-like MFS transporter
LLANGAFLALLLCVFLLRFGQHMVEPYVALWIPQLGALPAASWLVADPEHAVARTIALAFAVLAVAQLLFSTVWGRLADAIGPLRCLAAVGLGLAAVFFCTAQVKSIEGYMALRCAAAVFMAGNMTLAFTAVARRVDAGSRSLAFSLVQSGMQYGLALGPVVGVGLVGGAGMSSLYLLGGACLTLAGVGMIVVRAVSVAGEGEVGVKRLG